MAMFAPRKPAHDRAHQRSSPSRVEPQRDPAAGGAAARHRLSEQLPRRRLRHLQVPAAGRPGEGTHRVRLPAVARGNRRGLYPGVPERAADRRARRPSNSPSPGSMRRVTGRVTGREQLTHDITRLQVQLDEALPYRAGQFANISTRGRRRRPAQLFVRRPRRRTTGKSRSSCARFPAGRFSTLVNDEDVTGRKVTLRGSAGRLLVAAGHCAAAVRGGRQRSRADPRHPAGGGGRRRDAPGDAAVRCAHAAGSLRARRDRCHRAPVARHVPLRAGALRGGGRFDLDRRPWPGDRPDPRDCSRPARTPTSAVPRR